MDEWRDTVIEQCAEVCRKYARRHTFSAHERLPARTRHVLEIQRTTAFELAAMLCLLKRGSE